LCRIFPSLKIQKPGYDLYGSTTLVLTIIVIFVFVFFENMMVTESDLLEGTQGSNNIFKGNQALTLLALIFIILIERYVNRSDTKAVDKGA